MSFIIYDVETTGLVKCFDQIVQFAAVRADEELNIIEPFQIRCRLMPHVIPSPEAMHVTGLQIDELIDPTLPSHYTMVARIKGVLERWCPSLFLGFNSLSFDEEFLRNAFYQCLHYPYVTNSNRSARADVLNLCRVTAALRPDVLVPARYEDGRPLFKLGALAQANGISVPRAHEAMSDVLTTLALCQRIRAGAPEVWSQFIQFSQKRSVEAFLTREDAFLFSETFGNHHTARLVTRFGGHTEQSHKHYCLDLAADLEALQRLSLEHLTELLRQPGRPIVTIRTNAAPTLWALYDAFPEHLAPFNEEQVLARVAKLRADKAFVDRLTLAAQAAEPTYPPSRFVEEQLYDRRFPMPDDEPRLRQFHASDWSQRATLVNQFSDDRCRRMAQRLVYFESPESLRSEARKAIEQEIGRRLAGADPDKPRWRSIPSARAEIDMLLTQTLASEARQSQLNLAAYLSSR